MPRWGEGWGEGNRTNEIINNAVSESRQNRFRMKLDPFGSMSPMSHPHDLSFFGPCAYFETFRHCFSSENERVVSNRLKRIGQPAVDRLTVMKNERSLAMSDPFGSDDLAAKGISNRLMSQADAQDGDDLIEMSDRFHRNPGFRGRAG